MNKYCFTYLLIICMLSSSYCQEFHFVGDAKKEESVGCGDSTQSGRATSLNITPTSADTFGAVLSFLELDLSTGLTAQGSINFGMENSSGGEGFVILFYKGSIETFEPKGKGGYLAYQGLSPSLGIEFDTKFQSEPDYGDTIQEDHIAIVRDGDLKNHLAGPITAVHPKSGRPMNIEDGKAHFVEIDWDARNQLLRVYFDGLLRISYQDDIINSIFGGTDKIKLAIVGTTGSVPVVRKLCLAAAPELKSRSHLDDCADLGYLEKWIQLNNPDDGMWGKDELNYAARAVSVTPKTYSLPTMLVTPVELIDVEIQSKITVNTTSGGGLWGIVWGLKKPFGHRYDQYETYLLDWGRETQDYCGGSIQSQPGVSVSKIDGFFPNGCSSGQSTPHLGGHQNGPDFEPKNPILWGQNVGWEYNTTYEFKLRYTATEMAVWINNILVYEEAGYFEPGRFGFYNYSQDNVKYSNFSVEWLNDFTVSAPVICMGDTLQLNYAWENSLLLDISSDFIWSSGEDIISSKNDNHGYEISAPKQVFRQPGTHDIQLAVTPFGKCEDTVLKEVFVKPLPAFDLGKDTTLCHGEAILLIAGRGQEQVHWQDGTIFPTYVAGTAGLYIAEKEREGCTFKDSIKIDITPEIIMQSAVKPSCYDQNNGAIDLDISGGLSPLAVFLNDEITASLAFQNLRPGIYALEIKDQWNCSINEEFKIEEMPEPVYAVDASPVTCFGGDDGNLYAAAMSPDLWFSLGGTKMKDIGHFEKLTTGSYLLLIEDEIGCQYTEEVEVEGPIEPIFRLTKDTFIYLGERLTLSAHLLNGGNSVQYFWSPRDSLSCADCPMPVASPSITTNYTVTAVDENGCQINGHIEVEVNRDIALYFPNVFSPNGDGLNDLFYPSSGRKIGSIDKILKLEIFNPWGGRIFRNEEFLSDDPAQGWDGTFKGKPLNQGIFPYQAIVLLSNGREISVQGFVTILL